MTSHRPNLPLGIQLGTQRSPTINNLKDISKTHPAGTTPSYIVGNMFLLWYRYRQLGNFLKSTPVEFCKHSFILFDWVVHFSYAIFSSLAVRVCIVQHELFIYPIDCSENWWCVWLIFFYFYYSDLPSWLDELMRWRRWFSVRKNLSYLFLWLGWWGPWSWFDSSVMSASIDLLLFYSANSVVQFCIKKRMKNSSYTIAFIDRRRLIHLREITSHKK